VGRRDGETQRRSERQQSPPRERGVLVGSLSERSSSIRRISEPTVHRPITKNPRQGSPLLPLWGWTRDLPPNAVRQGCTDAIRRTTRAIRKTPTTAAAGPGRAWAGVGMGNLLRAMERFFGKTGSTRLIGRQTRFGHVVESFVLTHVRRVGKHARHVGAHVRHVGAHERHVGAHARHVGAHERHTGAHTRHTGAHERHTGAHTRLTGNPAQRPSPVREHPSVRKPTTRTRPDNKESNEKHPPQFPAKARKAVQDRCGSDGP
jgi:hypothetical protein